MIQITLRSLGGILSICQRRIGQRAMLTGTPNPPREPDTEAPTPTPRTHKEASRELAAKRDEMRNLVKEIDQEVADAEQRRSDREDQ